MQLINKKTLLGMIPLSEKAIYNMEKRGDFPKRIALTHSIINRLCKTLILLVLLHCNIWRYHEKYHS